MDWLNDYFPRQVNSGWLLTGYTLDELKQRIESSSVVLPICSLGTPLEQLAELAPLVLPPLYHEALDQAGREPILERVRECFPYLRGTPERGSYGGEFQIMDFPRQTNPPPSHSQLLAFSVDTAVEEHGPHLPLATDTMQSYAVLDQLSREFPELSVGPPVEYGHLTWGLPFGLSIDLTPALLTRYVTGFANAVLDWSGIQSLYVVDVHGSIVHRKAIQTGLAESRCDRSCFRWLHEPLVEFAGDRGDQHAGGVETALIHLIRSDWVDSRWWPEQIEALAERQMPLADAVELTPNLTRFAEVARERSYNGIVGDVRNYYQVDAAEMMQRMLDVARADVQQLLSGLH